MFVDMVTIGHENFGWNGKNIFIRNKHVCITYNGRTVSIARAMAQGIAICIRGRDRSITFGHDRTESITDTRARVTYTSPGEPYVLKAIIEGNIAVGYYVMRNENGNS